MRKSLHRGYNESPPFLSWGRIDRGLGNIEVRLIDYPDPERMKLVFSKGVKGTCGNEVDSNEISEDAASGLFTGGLQNARKNSSLCFEISGVSLAFTHQIVRTGLASFMQLSMRFTWMKNPNLRIPESIWEHEDLLARFDSLHDGFNQLYQDCISRDIPYQDARYILPSGTETYIMGIFPLHVWLDTYAYRACPMFMHEMSYVWWRMKQEVRKVNPWLAEQAVISCEKSHKCMFQGREDVKEEDCGFSWRATHERRNY